MKKGSVDTCVTEVPVGVDGAVGVPGVKWFAAVVNPRHEKSVAEKLGHEGIETYVASQAETRVWKNGKRKVIDRVLISSVVFVKCTEAERRRIVHRADILRFLVNRSANSGTLNKPVAVIPGEQIEKLKFILGHSDTPVSFEPTLYKAKDQVRVIRGRLTGLEGEIMKESDGHHSLLVRISMLGGAKVTINPLDVEKIS